MLNHGDVALCEFDIRVCLVQFVRGRDPRLLALTHSIFFVVVGSCCLAGALLLLNMDDAEVKHRYLDLVGHLDVPLLTCQIKLGVSTLVKLIILLLQLCSLLSELCRLFQ